MAEGLSLNATVRTQKGKGASRRMRRLENNIPAVVYGGSGEPLMLSLSGNELVKVSKEERFYSQILDLNIDGKAEKAVVRDIQRDPASGRFQHLDFLRIVADQAITVSVPLHFLNEESCVGVKMEGGTFTRNLVEVEISCLPQNLPQSIEVDMAEVHTGSSIHLSDLPLPEGVSIVALSYGEDRDIPVASVVTRRGGSDVEEEQVSAESEDARTQSEESESEAE